MTPELNDQPVEILDGGPHVVQPDGSRLWVEPLGVGSAPSLTDLRSRWIGRWVLCWFADGTVDKGFVTRVWMAGPVHIELAGMDREEAVVQLAVDARTVLVADPQGRQTAIRGAVDRAACDAREAAAVAVESRNRRWGAGDDPVSRSVRAALRDAAGTVRNGSISVTATSLVRSGCGS